LSGNAQKASRRIGMTPRGDCLWLKDVDQKGRSRGHPQMGGLAHPQSFVHQSTTRGSRAANEACLRLRQLLLEPLLHRGRHGVLPPRRLRPGFQLLDVLMQRACAEHDSTLNMELKKLMQLLYYM